MTSEQHPAIDSVQPSDVPDVSRSPPEANMDKTDMLEDLAKRVAGMASVFAEANVAREKEREVLREKHVQVLTSIEETKNDVVAEAARLRNTIDSYEAKSEHDLKRLEEEMRTLLETKHSEAMSRIGELEERAAEVEKALVEEIENRKRHTESVLGMLQQKVEEISESVNIETAIRRKNHEGLTKRLTDSVEALKKELDEEKFRRDVLCTGVKQQMVSNHEEVSKRQLRVQAWTKDLIESLREAIAAEEGMREASQGSIINSISAFLQRFEEDIREEAGMS